MPASAELANKLRGGYTQEQLEAAFALVRNPTNWKCAIDATVVTGTDLVLLDFAVVYFTGGRCAFTNDDAPYDHTRVRAPGYYACVGA